MFNFIISLGILGLVILALFGAGQHVEAMEAKCQKQSQSLRYDAIRSECVSKKDTNIKSVE